MNLSWEQETIINNLNYFKLINLYLIKQLKEMNKDFQNLQLDSNKKIEDLTNELQLLRNELKEIENIRSFKVKIPESWIIKE